MNLIPFLFVLVSTGPGMDCLRWDPIQGRALASNPGKVAEVASREIYVACG